MAVADPAPKESGVKLELRPLVARRVGIDIGGVLVMHELDWPRARHSWHETSGVRRLVQLLGPPNVHVVSYARIKGNIREKIHRWLDVTDFCRTTGLPPNQIHFTTSRKGKAGKGPVAERLRLTKFADDQDEVLSAVYSDPAGNIGANIDAAGGFFIHFARSGVLRTPLPRPSAFGGKVPTCLRAVHSWGSIVACFHEIDV